MLGGDASWRYRRPSCGASGGSGGECTSADKSLAAFRNSIYRPALSRYPSAWAISLFRVNLPSFSRIASLFFHPHPSRSPLQGPDVAGDGGDVAANKRLCSTFFFPTFLQTPAVTFFFSFFSWRALERVTKSKGAQRDEHKVRWEESGEDPRTR